MSKADVLSKLDHEFSHVAARVKETSGAIGEKAGAAASTVGDMANRAATNLSADADELASIAGREAQRVGEQLSRNTPHSGILGNVSQSVARTVTAQTSSRPIDRSCSKGIGSHDASLHER